MILFGELALWVALMMAAWSAITAFAGGRTRRADLALSGERGMQVTWMLALAACAGVWTALLTRDFSLQYVAALTSANLPAPYAVTAFWSASGGVLLLRVAMLTSAALVVMSRWRGDRVTRTYLYGTLATFALIAIALVCFAENPYSRLDFVPPDGLGMQPRLQDPAMALRVPLIQAGYTAALVTLALIIAVATARQPMIHLASTIRRWVSAAWLLITLGVLVGMLAEYRVSGARGWLWEPVENRELLAWLAASAVLSWIVVRDSQAMRRVRRWKVGAIAAFVGLAALATGLVGVAVMSRDHDVRLKAGETFTHADPFGREWSFTSQGASRLQATNRKVAAIAVQLSRGEEQIGLVASEERQYVDSRENPTHDAFVKPGLRSSLLQDIVIRLANITSDEAATMRISFRPFASWIWLGGLLLAVGGMLMSWPSTRKQQA
jgi:cytochrome c biogenesis factor